MAGHPRNGEGNDHPDHIVEIVDQRIDRQHEQHRALMMTAVGDTPSKPGLLESKRRETHKP